MNREGERWNEPLYGKPEKQKNQPKPQPKPDKGNTKKGE